MTATTSTQLTLPYSAVNARGLAKTDWLVNAFQDIASRQHHELGISGFHMAPKGLKWVIAQYRIKIHTPMTWLTPFTLATWRYPWKNLYETRAFSVTGPDGQTFVTATGIWVLIKADTGKPVRLNRHLPQELMDQVPEEDPEMVKAHPPMDLDTPFSRFRVMFHDLDMNQHVNNAVYLKWAQESVSQASDHLPVEILISYLRECFYPETVNSHVILKTRAEGFETDHAIIRPETREVLARVAMKWRKVTSRAPLYRHD